MKKKFLTNSVTLLTILLVTLTIFFYGCSGVNSVYKGKQYPLTLTIAHINDTHAYLDPTTLNLYFNGVKTYTEVGGFPRLVTEISQLRADKDNFLFLHAGDVFQGTLYFTKYEGMADLEFLELMGLDAMCIGNHEFDEGPQTLATFIDEADFPILSANIDASAEPILNGKILPHTIKQFGTEKVGIIGLTTPQTATTSSPGVNVVFLDPIDAAQTAVDGLTSQGINKIILLTHLGIEEDVEVAKTVSDIDIIIGGHSHTLLGDFSGLGLSSYGEYPYLVQNPDENNVLIVQSWEYDKVLGVLDVEFDKDGRIVSYEGNPKILSGDTFIQKDSEGKKVPVSQETYNAIVRIIDGSPVIEMVDADPSAKQLLADYAEPIKGLKKEVIAQANEDFLHIRIPGARHSSGVVLERGSQIAPIVADAMLWKAQSVGLKAQIAIENAGGVRIDIPQGDITVGQVYELLPFGNTLVVLDLTGNEIKSALNSGIIRATTTSGQGAFPYIAGLRYTADMTQSASLGTRQNGNPITSIEVKNQSGEWESLNNRKTYRVILNSFTAHGGDAYTIFANSTGYRYDTGFVDAEVFMEYAEFLGTLNRPTEVRITLIHNTK